MTQRNKGISNMSKKPLLVATALDPAAKKMLYAEIEAWHLVEQALAPLVAKEKELRAVLCEKWFEGAEEGTNTLVLEFGKALKIDKRVNRKIDEVGLDAKRQEIMLGYQEANDPDSKTKFQAMLSTIDE